MQIIPHTEFTTAQYDLAYPDGIENHYWNRARNSIIMSVLKGHGLAQKRMLEIGCGRGLIVKDLRKNGYTCHGVDLAPLPVDATDEFTGYLYYGIDFNDLNPTFRESIEVLLLCDVIEHIPNTSKFLESVRNAFPSAQYVLITVPARSELWSNYDKYYGHVVRYSLPLLSESVEKIGYHTRYISYFFHLLYVPALFLSIIKKDRAIKVFSPRGIMRHIHTCLTWFFILEQKVIPRTLLGTSIIYLVERERL